MGSDVTKIVLLYAIFGGLGILAASRFFLSPVERRLREWAGTLDCELVDYGDPGFFEQFRRPLSWLWAPWGVWRVTVRDRAGREHVAVVRFRGLRAAPNAVDVRWDEVSGSGLTRA